MRSSTIVFCLIVCACGREREGAALPAPTDTLVVYNASSLSGPMRALIDTFSMRTGALVHEEHGASLEMARRITSLQRIPDVIALADREVFAELLMPASASWYAAFARNRMVVAYTEASRYSKEINQANWRTVLLRSEVHLGRADPVLAPAGYRTLILYALAEKYYREPGLAAKLTERTPLGYIRGNAADLAALLAVRELDYIIEYQSLAKSQKLKYINLPAEIDLGDASRAADYGATKVPVSALGTTVVRTGAPILYGVSIPRQAPHRAVGERFLAFMLSREGRALLKAHDVDMVEQPSFVGDSVPAAIRAAAVP